MRLLTVPLIVNEAESLLPDEKINPFVDPRVNVP